MTGTKIFFSVLCAILVAAGVLAAIRWVYEDQERANAVLKEGKRLTKQLEQPDRSSPSLSNEMNLDVDEIKIPASTGQRDVIANQIIAAAERCGGSAAKNLSTENGLLLFAEIPSTHEQEFRERLTILGARPSRAARSSSTKNQILQIRVNE